MTVQETVAELGHDLRAGTARLDGVRQLYLCDDVLLGIQDALTYEAGEAWGPILHRCGRMWGDRVWERAALRHNTATRTVDQWVEWFTVWFAEHGWGRIEVDLEQAMSHGFVVVRLHDSPLPPLFADEKAPEPVDHLVAGLIEAQFCQLSGQSLRALEIGCTATGHDHCTIVVVGTERGDALEDCLLDGGTYSDAMTLLRTP